MHNIRPSSCGGEVGTGVRALFGAARLLGCRFRAGTLIRHFQAPGRNQIEECLELFSGTRGSFTNIKWLNTFSDFDHEFDHFQESGRRDHFRPVSRGASS